MFLTEDSIAGILTDLSKGVTRVSVATGYIKSGKLSETNLFVRGNTKIFTRWRLSDLATGASDLKAYEEVRDSGGRFFINHRLHAKIFLLDNTVVIGSANATFSGLITKPGSGNLEAAVLLDADDETINFFRDLESLSVELDDKLYEEICNEIAAFEVPSAALPGGNRMPRGYERALRKKGREDLRREDLPWCVSPAEFLLGVGNEEALSNDEELLSLIRGADVVSVAEAFRMTRAYFWFVSEAHNETRFGELSAKLHDAVKAEPRPYRKEIKILLQNLISWMTELYPDNVRVMQHRHTRTYQFS